MKRIIIIAIILLILVLSTLTVYNNYIDKSKINRIDIRGTVTNISVFGNTTTILVEGQKEDDTYYDKASIRTDVKTLITKDLPSKKINVGEIKIGDKIEVTFTGPVAESYPVQAVAQLINIINQK